MTPPSSEPPTDEASDGTKASNVEAAWAYLSEKFHDKEVLDSFRLLAEYRPAALVGYVDLRAGASISSTNDCLSDRERALVLVAIACSLRKRPPVTHARAAVQMGLGVGEIAEVVALCAAIGGMVTYQDTGQYVLKDAQNEFQKLADH